MQIVWKVYNRELISIELFSWPEFSQDIFRNQSGPNPVELPQLLSMVANAFA